LFLGNYDPPPFSLPVGIFPRIPRVQGIFYFRLLTEPPVCRFGADVMDTVAVWTKSLCSIIEGRIPSGQDSIESEVNENLFSNYPVLDVGTGNGLLLQALAKQGYYPNFLNDV
jgi:hypothetical protein